MELLLDLFMTAFVAICFSFLVAKLVSIAAIVDDGLARRDLGLQHSSKIVEEEPPTEDLKFDRGLEVEGTQSKRRVQFVVEQVVGKVDEFEGQGSVDDSSFDEQLVDKCCEEEQLCGASTRIEAEDSSHQVSQVVGLSVNSPELVRGFQSAELNESIEGDEFCGVREGKIINHLIVDEKIENEQPDDDDDDDDDETVEELGTEDFSANQSGDVDDPTSAVKGEFNRIDEEKKGRVSEDEDDDDDWEGIERSELEKVFATAANYVAIGGKNDRLSNLESDVQMQFYGLHKVATEGPCHEAQPMALMVSARAKWNAWQRLGNISPEVAMEQYISLLSNKDPGWMMQGSDSAEDGDSDSSEAAKPEDTQRSCVTERKQEQMPGTEGVLTGGSSSVKTDKE